MRVCKGTFALNTSTGSQTVSGIADGAGAFTPTGLIVWTTFQTSAAFTDEQIYQMGFTDGTRSRTMYARQSDNNTPNDGDRSGDTTNLILVRNLTGTNQRVVTFTSFGSGQFTINSTTATDGSAILVHFLAFGDVNVHVTTVTAATMVLTEALSFQPDAVMLMTAVGPSDGHAHGLGWYVRETGEQGVSLSQIEEGQATSDTARYQSDVSCYGCITGNVTGLDGVWSFNRAFLQEDDAVSGGVLTYGFFLGGCAARAGAGLQPTSTGTQAISGLDMTPKVVFVQSVGNVASATVDAECRWSFGAGDGSAQGHIWNGAADNVNPMVTARRHNASTIVVMATPDATGGSSTTEAEAALDSLDEDGFTLDWTAADATQRQYLWLAMGDAPAVGGGGGEHSHVFVG